MQMLSAAIASLYATGENRTLIRLARPGQIISCIRRHSQEGDDLTWKEILDILQKENFTQEALFLSNEANLESAFHLLGQGKIITLGCDCYPKLLGSTLGMNAPPILWISDPQLRKVQPWNNNDGSQRIIVSAVGCRTPLAVGQAIANQVGLWSASKGFLSVSGGAVGCDTAFGRAAHGAGGEVVHILPHGINHVSPDMEGFGMSICPPDEPFSPGRAMERNSLIYAFGHMTVVCSARYRQGGSWHGASIALKAHRPVVVADWTSTGVASTLSEHVEGTYAQAQRTLANLGARPMMLDLQTFREDIKSGLDGALDWSLDRIAGNINSGLFRGN